MEDKSTLRVILAGMQILGKLIDKKSGSIPVTRIEPPFIIHKDQ